MDNVITSGPSNSRRMRAVGAAVLAVLMLVPTSALAQSRRGGGDNGGRARAVPRGSVRQPPRGGPPSRPYYSRNYRVYRPGANLNFFYGSPGFYGAYRYGSPYWGSLGYGGPYGSGYPAFGMSVPYGYGYSGYSGQPYGGVRIDLPQRDAEVFIDGYFVGTVDDFDGVRQQANLEAGPHRVEVRDQEFEPISFEVNVQPGRTITYRGDMRPLHP
jgi:hypothetical protein